MHLGEIISLANCCRKSKTNRFKDFYFLLENSSLSLWAHCFENCLGMKETCCSTFGENFDFHTNVQAFLRRCPLNTPEIKLHFILNNFMNKDIITIKHERILRWFKNQPISNRQRDFAATRKWFHTFCADNHTALPSLFILTWPSPLTGMQSMYSAERQIILPSMYIRT